MRDEKVCPYCAHVRRGIEATYQTCPKCKKLELVQFTPNPALPGAMLAIAASVIGNG